MATFNTTGAWERFTGYFKIKPFLIPQAEAEQSIREGVSFRGVNLLMLIVAIFIASLGLNTNSTAVIIGAMLISPLMGPIIGIGLAVGIHDFELMKHSFRNLLMATVFSVLTSGIYFLLSPVKEGHSELLARTSPMIYDVFIGFFGGAAGILAIGSRVKGNVIPGVAIATALMPPLCTVGYGLATLQMHYFLGALYLFFINSVFIALATTVGVRMMGYSYKSFADSRRARRVRRIVYSIAVVTMIPAAYMTYTMYLQNNFVNDCGRFVSREFDFASTQVVSSKAQYKRSGSELTVLLMGQPLDQDSLMRIMTHRLSYYGLSGTRLRIIQGAGAVLPETKSNVNEVNEVYAAAQAAIATRQSTIDSLRQVVAYRARLDSASAVVAPEVKVLFPAVVDLAVSRAVSADIEDGRLDTLYVALIRCDADLPRAQRERLRQYLQTRLQVHDIHLVEDRNM